MCLSAVTTDAVRIHVVSMTFYHFYVIDSLDNPSLEKYFIVLIFPSIVAAVAVVVGVVYILVTLGGVVVVVVVVICHRRGTPSS
jgi:hypothetical protein